MVTLLIQRVQAPGLIHRWVPRHSQGLALVTTFKENGSVRLPWHWRCFRDHVVSSQVCVLARLQKQGKDFVTCPGLCPGRVLLYEVCPCVYWDMLCVWFAQGQGSSPVRWERSSCTRSVQFSPAIGSIHSGSFFTELRPARPKK